MKKTVTLLFLLANLCIQANAVTYSVTVPAGTKACYIAGEMNSWTQQVMTKVSETKYTLNIDGATTAQKYKYCSGPSWTYVEKSASGGDVSDRTYSANDVVAKWGAIYNPNITAGNITFTATVPSGTVGCYIVGTFQTPTNFDAMNPYPMTKNANGTFSVTLTNVVDVSYKYVCGAGTAQDSWFYEEMMANGDFRTVNRFASISNGTTVNDVVENWKNINNGTTDLRISSSINQFHTQHGVIIGAVTGDVKVYTLTGQLLDRQVAQGYYESPKLQAGIYVVLLDQQSLKIAIK